MSGDSDQADKSAQMFDAIERAHVEYEKVVLSRTLDYLRSSQHTNEEELVGQSVSASNLDIH